MPSCAGGSPSCTRDAFVCAEVVPSFHGAELSCARAVPSCIRDILAFASRVPSSFLE